MTRHVVLPPERFYWALLDGSRVGGPRRKREEGLSYLFEAQIPEPLEAVQAVYRDAGNGRFVACAMSKAALRAETPGDAVTLGPQSLPAFVDAEVDPRSLNLLVGEFTPASVLEARRRHFLETTAVVGLCAVLVVVGFERRRAACESKRESALTATSQLYENSLGYKSAGAALPPPLQLQAELRTLKKTRLEAPTAESSRDAALSLARLLSSWPRDAHAEVDSLQVTGGSIHVQGDVATNEDAQALATALAGLVGWRAEIPSVRAADPGVRFTLQWNREEKGAAR